MEAQIVSIQVGLPRTEGDPQATDPMQRRWTSGFVKEPISGTVTVGRTNLVGDGQADLRLHGGVDKAILSYGHSRYEYWLEKMPDSGIGPGGMGENLTVTPWTEDDVCLGDRWQIGDVVLEVSQPRQPCWKLSRRWQNKLLTRWVTQTGYGGWYHRVISLGTIAAGDRIELIDRPHPAWSITRANDFLFSRQTDPAALWELMNLEVLAEAWKKDLR